MNNIKCKCGAEYGYKGIISKGCLYCFNCGEELVNYRSEKYNKIDRKLKTVEQNLKELINKLNKLKLSI